MAREAYNEKGQIQRVVEGDPEKSIVTGDVLGPLNPSGKLQNDFILQGNEIYFSRFRAGDRVELASIDPKTKKFKKLKDTVIRSVRFPKPGAIEILVPGTEFTVENIKDVFLLPKSFANIKWILRQRLQDISDAGVYPEVTKLNIQEIQSNFNRVSEKLNKTQAEALRFLIDNNLRGLVQGPPGTGKTHLLVDLVRMLVRSNLRVGLASLTHTAVDNALARIIHSGVSPEQSVRIASEQRKVRTEPYKAIPTDSIWSSSFRVANVESELEQNSDHLLYAATLHTWCLSQNTPEIDVLIIDEASQVPIYFHPFFEAISPRVIMFGDHKQLPPVIQITKHNLPAEDVFSYEIEQGQYPMLEIQYRMNEGIQEWSSNRFYYGRLQPHETVRNRDLLRDKAGLSKLFGNREVNLLSHQGTSINNSNKIEASKVADLVYDLINKGDIALDEIGIVTPHRTQAGAVAASLQEKLGLADMQNVLVDTVERFQGQEKETMIFSMGVEKDNSRKGDKGFLGDGRRLNVAVTRAKSRFYCVAPEKLVEFTNKQRNAENLKSFLNWCADPNTDLNKKETA